MSVGEHAQRVDLAAARVLVLAQGVRRLVRARTRGTSPRRCRNGPSWPCVRMTLGGNGEPSSGHTRSPSSRTSYGVVEAGSSPVQWTSA